ncbi:sulfotransferase [Defluviimonas sp. D31]|uniref:sulfotransferase n=1 Tax=Defluviimonas sp. D31 TaxID=3083253 RepID=UPI00296E3184|nr:sulfotransferase [Defluviimonas sp. D31]MDW4549352.1 sulfotransferase [Defluviimonas sp. D31]
MAVLTATEIQNTYAEALRLQNAGNREAALRIYLDLITDHPRVAEAQYQIGVIHMAENRFSRAIPHLEAAAQLKPAEGAIWKVWTEAVALGGDAAAEETYLRLLKTAPVPVNIKLALQDRFGARRSSTRPATRGVPPAEMRRLVGLMDASRPAEAEQFASRLLVAHPGSAPVLNILATAQSVQGKAALAEAAFRKSIAAEPGYAEAHDNFGRFLIDQRREREAIDHFREAVILAPGLPSALVNFASALTRTGNAEAALVLLDRAERAGVNAAALYMALGNVRMRMKNYAGAEEAFARSLDASKGKAIEAIGMLAQAQARIGKDDEALANFNRALEFDKDSPVATAGKATLLQAFGNFEEADVLFRRSFELDPDNGENYRVFIASHKTKPGDPIIDQMLRQYENPRLSVTDRMNLGFALAKALEDTKDYGRVFHYLDEANRLMWAASPHNMAARRKVVDMTKNAYADFDWHGASIEGATDYAPIFVTGMPRSGTTLVEQIIASHSTVSGAGEVGEAAQSAHRFLADGKNARAVGDIPAEEIADLGREMERILRARRPEAERVTDKSIQSYMHLGLIRLAMPNARFVVVRRDPRDNLLSIYKNKFPEDTHQYAYDQRELVRYYGTFVEMIDFWRELVPDWFYEVQYEELVANPEEETRKLIAACGLDWEDACLSFHETKRKIETLSVYQVRQPITKSSVKGWQRYEKELKPMLDALREGGYVAD